MVWNDFLKQVTLRTNLHPQKRRGRKKSKGLGGWRSAPGAAFLQRPPWIRISTASPLRRSPEAVSWAWAALAGWSSNVAGLQSTISVTLDQSFTKEVRRVPLWPLTHFEWILPSVKSLSSVVQVPAWRTLSGQTSTVLNIQVKSLEMPPL